MAQTYFISVRRIFCALCRHTFVLLPSFVKKFHRYAKETIRVALRLLKTHTYEAVASMFKKPDPSQPCLAPLTLYFWRRKFA